MGAATSLEEIEEVKMILSADNPRFNSMSPMSKELLKAALTSKDLSDSKIRRLRAAALGRRCVCVVEIGSGGFSLQHVLLCEGQVVSFKVNDENGDDEDYRIKQVVDNGEDMVDVVGGYGNDTLPVGDHYEQQFNLAGEYRFVIDDNKTHLLVEVHPRKDIEAKVTDSGFEPSIIRLDEGNSVVWSWEESAIPRYVREASFEVDRWIMRPYRDSKVPTRSGTFKKTFNKPGMYYFQASGMNSDESHFCIVQVRERQREYRVMVEDNHFDPQIIVIEEGDRIWWDWTKNEGERYHCVFEAKVSPKDGKIEPSKTNFSWPKPTKFGLMSREYFEAGIYFYGDREFKKVANYVCTVIVKPAQRDHFVEVNKAGFAPDILQVSLGDRTWYTWLIERDEEVTDVEEFVVELEKVTTGDQPKCGPEKSDEQFMGAILSKQKYRVGLELATANQIGVYHHHHKLSGGTCSVICQDGSRNHTITVTDSGFEPLHLTAYLNDRVWWIWQDAKRKHFILQVNSSGRETEGGFSSGYPMFSPSAFMFQFVEAGKYHYKSTGHIEDIFGIIDVHVRPTVRTVVVEPGRMEPEPVTIATGDVVAWTFTRPTPHEVEEVNTFDDVINAQVVPRGILPRKCMSKSFRKPGVFHYASKSFVNPKNSSSRPEDQSISSVIVSEVEDAVIVRIDDNGYHPNHLDLPEDDFVIFDWKKSKQAHNVFEVDKNGRAIEYNNNNNNDADDGEGFTRSVIRSGEPEMESSFVHYFDLSGVFRVASANGKEGEMCVIDVKKNVDKTPAPQIVDYEFVSLKVRRGHVVHLTCGHPKAEIYYTLDGGLPYLHRKNVQRYDRARGIELSRVGITFIRSVAVATGCRRSDVFTSKKFFVLPGDDDDYGKTPLRNKDGGDKEEEEMIDQIIIDATPIIDGSSIIRWDLNQNILKRISGLQFDINGITSNLSVHPQSKGLKISGLSPDTNYNVKVVSYLDEGQPPLHSNALTLQNSHKDGRMSITLKSAPTPDSVLLMWKHLDEQVQGYQVFLNGAACGHVILPDQEAYSILLSNLKFRTTNKVSVAAILKDGKDLRHSNEVHFLLPSNESCALLPGSEGTEIIPIEELAPIEFLTEDILTSREPAIDGNKKGVRFAVPKSDTGSSDGQKSTVRDLIAKKRNFTTLLSAEAVDDDSVPMAHLTVKSERDNNSILVSWIFKKEFSEDFKRTSNYINVIGKSFGPNVNSDLSFECFMETNEAVPAIQHVWNVSAGDNHCLVEGLKEDTVYKIHAVTCYEKIELSNDEKILEVQATSPSVTYKTQQKSKCRLNLKVISSEPNKAKLTWSRDCLSVKSAIVGYQIIADGNPMGNLIDPNLNEILLEKLLPGKSVNVGVIPKLEDPNEVVPIETIQIFCPRRPMPPVISEHPTNNKLKSAIIAWNYPEQGSQNERQGHDDDDTDQLDINDDISTFRVYVDNKCKDVIKVTPSRTKHGYQCTLDQLISGGSHDVFVTSCVGNDDDVTATTDVVMISSESVPSNIVSISLPVPAQSPQLRIENMNSNGIELSWDVLQQNGDEQIAGYQLYKNNKLYGSMLPSHAHNTTIKNLKLGESINLKMVAVPKEKGQYKDELENGVSIKVEYSGIVSAPTRVWTEKVTGHSAIIKWSMGEQLDHYDKPDSYQLTWWPGTRADSDISSASTSDEQMTLAGLKEGKLYTVVVESRSKHSYIEVNGTSGEEINRSIIVTSRSDPLTFHTSSPLSPPSDFAINSTTCDSVLITWEFNGDDANNVLGYRIDAIPTKDILNGNQNSPDLVTFDLPRGSKQAKVIGLKEKTEYLITLTVVTKEYFEQTDADSHKSKKKHLPKGQPAPRNKWLPCSSIKCFTSGTDIATDLRVVSTGPDRVTLKWSPVRVHGSNRLLETAVKWSRIRNHNGPELIGKGKVIQSDREKVTIDGLEAGETYKFVVVATVSQKTNLADDNDELLSDLKEELENRIDTQLFSRSVVARTSAPCNQPPHPIITGFTTNSCHLFWEKPSMHLAVGNKKSNSIKHLKLTLLGYRMEVNGKPHMRISPATQSCTLVKCKPGKKYSIVLAALTCPSAVLKTRKKDMSFGTLDSTMPSFEEWRDTDDDNDCDVSPSEPLTISIPPLGSGLLSENMAKFVSLSENKKHKPETNASGDKFGNVLVKWSLQNDDVRKVKQFIVTWKTIKDDGTSVQQESYEADTSKCHIPISSKKCLIEVLVQARYDHDEEDDLPRNTQHVQALIPGPPDRPDLWLKTVREKEFVVEWATPTLNGGKLDGYQLIINGKKADGKLSIKHTRAVIPCKPRRLYHVTLLALSTESHLGSSEPSEVLTVSTFPNLKSTSRDDDVTYHYKSGYSKRYDDDDDDNNNVHHGMGDDYDVGRDDNELPLRVKRVESNFIELDWRDYNKPDEAEYFKVKWKLHGRTNKKEVKLSSHETNCILHNCIPGSVYSISMYVYNNKNKIVDRSSSIKVMTPAPLKPPVLSLRALNFNYVTIEWNDVSAESSLLIGYKVFMNGVLQCTLQRDQNAYSYTGGEWCKEFLFQVQALADQESYNSILSDPLVVTWPGVLPPNLLQTQTKKSNAVRIVWDRIIACGNAKIKSLKLILYEAESGNVIRSLHLPNNLHDCEIENLPHGNYNASMEIQLHGTHKTVKTENTSVSSVPVIQSPIISVKVLNLETRRILDAEAAGLVNRRDKLLSLNYKESFLPSTVSQKTNSRDVSELKDIDGMLDSCLSIIDEHFSGSVNVLLTWSLPEAEMDRRITGMQIFINGRKYGQEIKPSIRSIPIVLSATQFSYQIFMTVISTDLNFKPSNVVEISTDPFQPFSFFSFLSQKPRKKNNIVQPIPYSDTLAIERKYSSKKPVHEGQLRRPVGISTSCMALQVIDGSTTNLFSSSKSGFPFVVYFWSPQSFVTIRILEWLRNLIELNRSFNILTVLCGSEDQNPSTNGVENLVASGWTDGSKGSHFFGNASPDGSEALTEIFEVVGFPTFVFLNTERNIVWRGRYCALDFDGFKEFIDYVLAGISGNSAQALSDPWLRNIQFGDSAFRNQLLSNCPNIAFGNNKSTPIWASKIQTAHKNNKKDVITVTKRPKTSIYGGNAKFQSYTGPKSAF